MAHDAIVLWCRYLAAEEELQHQRRVDSHTVGIDVM